MTASERYPGGRFRTSPVIAVLTEAFEETVVRAVGWFIELQLRGLRRW